MTFLYRSKQDKSYSELDEPHLHQDEGPTGRSAGTPPMRIPTRDLFANPMAQMMNGSPVLHGESFDPPPRPLGSKRTSEPNVTRSTSPASLVPSKFKNSPSLTSSNYNSSPKLRDVNPIVRRFSSISSVGDDDSGNEQSRSMNHSPKIPTPISLEPPSTILNIISTPSKSSFTSDPSDKYRQSPTSVGIAKNNSASAPKRNSDAAASIGDRSNRQQQPRDGVIDLELQALESYENERHKGRQGQGSEGQSKIWKSITLPTIPSFKSLHADQSQQSQQEGEEAGEYKLSKKRRGGRRKLFWAKEAKGESKEKELLQFDDRMILPFILDLGVALQCFGAPAHRSEYRLYSVAKRFSLNGHFIALPSALICTISQCGSHPYFETTHTRRVPGIDYNMQRLCIADQVADQVAQGLLDPEEGAQKIEEALLLPALYNQFLKLMAFTFSAAGIVLLFGKGYPDMIASLFTGTAVGIINYLAGKWPSMSRLNEVFGAFCAYLTAYACLFIYPINSFTCALAGICWHLPGLSLTIAMEELSTGNRVSGTARVSGAFVTLFLLGLGLSGGDIFTNLLPQPATFALRPDLKTSDFGSVTDLVASLPPAQIPLWVIFIAIIICCISFGVFLNVRYRDMRIAVLSGLCGFCGWLLGAKYLPTDLGNFLGAVSVAICSNLYARYEKIPSVIGSICGILLLVPGSVGQRGINSFMHGESIKGLNFVFNMLLISMQIVAGLFVGNAIIDPHRAL